MREVMAGVEVGRGGDTRAGEDEEERKRGEEQGRGEGVLAGRWSDDRAGSVEGLDGQLQELIARLREEKTAEVGGQMEAEVESMLQQAGEPQPSQLSEVSEEDEPPQPVSDGEEEAQEGRGSEEG